VVEPGSQLALRVIADGAAHLSLMLNLKKSLLQEFLLGCRGIRVYLPGSRKRAASLSAELDQWSDQNF
jgi:hypothetical protein